jgi:hypothetical protein
MHLQDLRDFVATLVDYDPTNETYVAQLTSLLNQCQKTILTDRPWDFAQREGDVTVWTDVTYSISVTNGSATVASASLFPISTNAQLPGSQLDGAIVEVTDSAGLKGTYTVAWVRASNQLYFTSDFAGATGTYNATFKRREIYLPGDTQTVMSVLDLTTGIPRSQVFLSKYERDDCSYDPTMLGTPTAYIPSQGRIVPAPRVPTGVSTIAAVGQGVRTINIFQVSILVLTAPGPSVYPAGVSGGMESGLSKVGTYALTDLQTLTFTPETIPNKSGFYRRYYFTCPELGINAPVRIVSAGGGGYAAAGVDTVSPLGAVTLAPDLSTTTLTSESFQSTSIRYVPTNGVYQSFLLYPHPSSTSPIRTRRLVAPRPMEESQDVPLVPEAYAEIIAFAALEQLCLKMDNAALSAVYAKKKEVLFRQMEQKYLGDPPRRIVKGQYQTGYRAQGPWWGPLKLLP